MFNNYKHLAYFIILCRNYSIINFINYATTNKENIKMIENTSTTENTSIESKQMNTHVSHLQIVFLETIKVYTIHTYLNINENYLFDIITFIPISFLYEIIFDLFHYWIHRTCHVNNFLYRNIHKKHHKHYNLTSIVTFYQNPLDFILSVIIPEIITLFILQSLLLKISSFQFILILNYKLFSEIAGHSGKHTNSCGFVQFIWLPKFFNIEILTEDHDLHHKLLLCNYSKRFVIWDKLFNTYTKSLEYQE